MTAKPKLTRALKLTREDGFPARLVYPCYWKDPTRVVRLTLGKVFYFRRRGPEFYPDLEELPFAELTPDGRELYWGNVRILSRIPFPGNGIVGSCRITNLYSSEEQQMRETRARTSPECNFFAPRTYTLPSLSNL